MPHRLADNSGATGNAEDAQHCKMELEHPRYPPWPTHDVYPHAEGALGLFHPLGGNMIYVVAPHLKRRLAARSLYEVVGQRRRRPTIVERRGRE